MIRKIIPYNPALKEFATQLRNNSTKAEIILWQKLKRKQMHGYDFHRQKPVGNYILDFFCQELMLGIEADGYSHEFLEVYNKDVVKKAKMNEFGITVLRFSDHQVLKDAENVLRAIEQYIYDYEEHTPSPSREGSRFTHPVIAGTEEHIHNPSQEGNTLPDISFTHTDLRERVEAPRHCEERSNLRGAGGVLQSDSKDEELEQNFQQILEEDNELLKRLSDGEHTPNPSQEGNTQPDISFTHTDLRERVEAPLLRGAGGVLKSPPHLKPSDRVGIVSTAKRTEPHEIEQGLATLQSWGLVPVIGQNAFNEYGFLAGTDAERLADLQQMLDDDSIKAIFFTKGGYGTLRIIDGINWDKFRQSPKWLVGYSDITLLHCHVHNFGVQSLHGVMLQGYAKATFESTESIRKILFGESLQYDIPAAADNRAGEAVTGTLVGGNLSMLYAVTGSESDIDTTGKILYIEDIDEYRYHYDRMLVSLKRAGKLSGLKAVIVGDMTDIKDSTLPWGRDYCEITLEHFDCPVYFDFPAGHITDNRALLLGATVEIKPFGNTIDIIFL